MTSSKRSIASSSSTDCGAKPGEFEPVVDLSKCEAKGECVKVCPVNVFEVRRIDDADFAKLGVMAKVKSVAYGRKTAYAPKASSCEACGKCVEACPEKAIKLARVFSTSDRRRTS
ncbi:MAG: 4Fe-4S dicluster domain-containing protein [Polyangiaceae bacterium]